MSESLTLITITMPSAPTVSYAPFQSQIVYLTTGDDHYRSTDGVMFLGNTIEDIDDISNEIDISQGQGAFATSMHGTISFADSCDGGRLLPLILNGNIPLIGASVFIQSEGDLRYNPVTLYLQSPSVDSDGILSFDMYSAQYTKGKKLIKWNSGTTAVGLSVGTDPASIDTGKALVGRYQGVSVPTTALGSPVALTHPSISLVGHTGNPVNQGTAVYGNSIAPEGKLPDPDDNVHRTFQYKFPTQGLRDSWFTQHYGNPESLTDFGTLNPYQTTIITDGTNVEFILFTSAEGKIYYAQNTDELPATILQKGTVAGSSPTIYTVDAVCSDNSALLSASVDDIKIYELQATNPICAGASGVVGYQSKADDAASYGIVKPLQLVYDSTVGTLVNKDIVINDVLNFCPAFPTDNNSFYALTKAKSDHGITFNNYSASISIGGTPAPSMTFNGFTSYVLNDVGAPDVHRNFSINAQKGIDQTGGNECVINISYRFQHNLVDSDFKMKIDNVYFDTSYIILGTTNEDRSHTWRWIDPFRSATQQTNTGHLFYTRTLANLQDVVPFSCWDHKFTSFADSVTSATSWSADNNYNSGRSSFSWDQTFNNIVAYIGTKLAYGSNPAVVTPSAFPGTANLTNTPVLAINNLATFAGINAKSFVGSHTTYPAAWGRYIDPSANVNDTIAAMAQEAWLFVSDSTRTDAVVPDSETLDPIVYKTGNLEDVVTEPSFNYDLAGTEAQFTAAISHVDEAFSLNKGSSYFWSGWQEKDTVMLGKACDFGPITATGVLNDCIVAICGTGTLHCSFDGGYSWPVSQQIVPIDTASSLATVTCGNGIIVATVMNHSSYSFAYYSTDYGRSWNPIATINGTAVTGGALSGIVISSWFDDVNNVLYLGGQSATGYAQIYMTTNGTDFSTINIAPSSTNLSGAVYSIAVRGNPTSNIAIAVGITGQSALLASAQGGAAGTWYAKTGVPSSQHIQYFNGHYRIFDSSINTMWSSENLIDWDSAVTTYSFSNSAESADGKIIIGYVNAGDFWYSRDSGTSWQLITWDSDEYSSTPGWLWDDYRSCFICPTILHTTIFSVADPAVYQLWQTCRAAYLASGVINSQSYDWSSVYNADDIIDMLNVRDGIDDSIQARRIEWLCRQPRYLEIKVNYQNVGNQLSVSSGQRIVIPRQRLEDSGLNDHIPTYGIITSVNHNIKSGVTKLQIGMPPVTV